MSKRLLIVGPKSSGSHLIAQIIEARAEPLRNVASIFYTKKTIIVPSAYLESPWMHKHIIALQQEAEKVLFLVPIKSTKKTYPPNFAQAFRIPVIGVITYKSIEYSPEGCLKAQKIIEEIGIKKNLLQIDLASQQDLEKLSVQLHLLE